VFERFTDGARQVVVLAQAEARALGHNYIGSEHILLGLLREQEDLAAGVLESFGINLEEARAKIVQVVGEGEEVVTGRIPFAPGGKNVFAQSLRETLDLRDKYLGTEHILLGLLRENDSVGANVLRDLGADAEAVRLEVLRRLKIVSP